MRRIAIVLVLAVVGVSATLVENTFEDEIISINLEAAIDHNLLQEVLRNPNSNAYWLFTRNNPNTPQILQFNDVFSVVNSNFDPTKQTIIISHGWLGNGNTQPNSIIRGVYLAKHDANVITIDWRRLALSSYATAAAGVPAVGHALGQFIVWLSGLGVRYDNIHLIGFELGAHLVASASRVTGGRIARITGLDPAGPLFTNNPDSLGPNDAFYVEAIHTNSGRYGIGTAIAQIDFFPNGGSSQPGCYTDICSHQRAYELFAATVEWDHIEGRLCTNNVVSILSCWGEGLRMGNDNLQKTGTRGSYRVETASRYPF